MDDDDETHALTTANDMNASHQSNHFGAFETGQPLQNLVFRMVLTKGVGPQLPNPWMIESKV